MRTRNVMLTAAVAGLLCVSFAGALPTARPAVESAHPAPGADAHSGGDADSAVDAAADWAIAGQLGGNVTDVAWLGRFALLGLGPRVAVFDITDPAAPRWVATSPQLPDVVWGIAVAEDRVYLAVGGETTAGALYVLDAADPMDLRVLGSLDLPAAAYDVQVAGDHAYLAVADIGLRVVDVRDPGRMVEVGALGPTVGGMPAEGWRLAVGEGMVVLAGWRSLASIIDVRDPAKPTRIRHVGTEATDVAIGSGSAFVATYTGLLLRIDLSDLNRPSTIGVGLGDTRLRSVAVDGTTIYVGDERGAVHVIDVALAGSTWMSGPVGAFPVDAPVSVTAMAVRSGVVLASSNHDPERWRSNTGWYAGALRVVDAARPAEARAVSTLRLPSSLVLDVDVTSDSRLAWMISMSGQVGGSDDLTPDFARNAALLVDSTDSARPHVRTSLLLPEAAEALALTPMGSVLYVLGLTPSDELAVYVFDVTDLDAPVYIQAVSIEAGDAGKVMRSEEYRRILMLTVAERLLVYVPANLRWLDVSDPQAPRLLDPPPLWASESTSWDMGVMVASDPWVYYVTREDLPGIMDFRDPSEPRLAAILPAEYVVTMAVSGQTLLVQAAEDSVVRAIDVSDWSDLHEVGRPVHLEASYGELTAFANHAFHMEHSGGRLTVLDISNPASIAVEQVLDPSLPASWEGVVYSMPPVVAAGHQRVYGSAYGQGLMVYAQPAEDPPVGDRPHHALLPAVYRAHQRTPPPRPLRLVDEGTRGLGFWGAWDLELSPDARHAYVPVEPAGDDCAGSLDIFDVAGLDTPNVMGTLRLPFRPRTVRVSDGLAFVAGIGCNPANSGVLAVIDVARPDQPRLVASIGLPQAVLDLALHGHWLYALNLPAHFSDHVRGDSGPPSVRVVDVANPAAPREVGRFLLGSSPGGAGIAIAGNHLLLADFSVGLRVLDLADPTAPREVATLPIPGAFDVAVEGRRAYVVGLQTGDEKAPSGLWIVDVADPARPRELGALVVVESVQPDMSPTGFRIAVSDGIAYSNRKGTLRAIDVRDPAWPYVLDEAESHGIGVAALGRRVVTVGDALRIFGLVER